MSRIALLLPLSLLLVLACDSAGPTSPDSALDIVAADNGVLIEGVLDVQPLGWLDSAVVNITTGQPITVALLGYPGFFEAIDLASVELYGAGLEHQAKIEENPECHIRDVVVYTDVDGNLLEVPEPVTGHIMHFLPDLGAIDDGTVVTMCLTGDFLETDDLGSPLPFPADWCVDVTVKKKGGGPPER